MLDLADRISRAAVAALDLAPFDDRYARLSRQVLAGGAARFEKAISAGEPIDLVVPVGLPHERLHYGALVVQQSQVGLLWRDAFGLDRARTAGLRPGASYSAVDLGGEAWTRFDLPADDGPLTFLVPPVSSPLLRTTLARVFHAAPGAAAPLATPAPDPEPAAVVMPDPPQPVAPPPPPVFGPAFGPSPEPTPASPAEPDTAKTPVVQDADEPVEPEVANTPAATPESKLEATQVHRFTGDDAATTVHALPEDLFRPEARQPAAPAPVPQATAHQPPAYVAGYQPPAYQPATHPAPLAVVAPAVGAVATGGSSISLRGFLLGFVGALAIGAIALAIRLLAG